MPTKTQRTKKLLTGPPKKIASPEFLSTGSTLLNLACSGRVNGGFQAGHIYYLVGESSSGKSFLSLTCMAEACNSPAFKNHRLIYDPAEQGALMDFRKFFGSGMASRVECDKPSDTVESLYFTLDDAVQKGDPFIYVVDSMDALSSTPERDKFEETKKAHRNGKATTGSYGDGKAKVNSANLRRFVNPIKESGSILILISQTRDNIGFGSQFNPKTRSGGRALTFYASLEIWSSINKPIKRRVNGKDRKVGVVCRCHVKKNRCTGRDVAVDLPIYWSYGFDDLGACVNFLIDEKHWESKADGKGEIQSVNAAEFDFTGKPESLVQQIEDQGKEQDLRLLVAEVWRGIEEQCELKRKPRYG